MTTLFRSYCCAFLLFSVIFPHCSLAQHSNLLEAHYLSSFINPGDDSTETDASLSLLNDSCRLNKIVFGYHPYWVGTVWQNYRWNLLSDLCYFSYEVDPSSGNAISLNGWETNPVIDTALANDVRVHLCVTLFSGHSQFFNNPVARQTLISNVIDLVKARKAHGVNLDFEAVPGSLSEEFNTYVNAFADSMHAAIPGSIVSIASPAVDWDGLLNIPELAQHLDYFMVMGYDYYWNGSDQAGPVAGLYPMTGSYLYSLSRTLSWYLSKGTPVNKLVMGLPYYGRDWKVDNELPPSNTIGSGTALTYRAVRNNYLTYSPENLRLEPNSRSPYYRYNISGWHQCFIDNVSSLGMKYDWVKRHSLAGIGIWALGYDNGYSELWDLLRDKFTNCEVITCSDTLYDSGGPAFNYYSGETYTQTVTIDEGEQISLEFYSFDLQAGHDTLFLYDGNSIMSPLMAALSGTGLPAPLHFTGNSFTLRFISDNTGTRPGWKAAFKCPTASFLVQEQKETPYIFPNPVRNNFRVRLTSDIAGEGNCRIYDFKGSQVGNELRVQFFAGQHDYSFSLEEIPIINRGVYLFVSYKPDKSMTICKLVY